MVFKNDEMFLLGALAGRRQLLEGEKDFMQKLGSGHQGEEDFAEVFARICPDLDLLGNFQSQVFGQDLQIDGLTCLEERLYHFEIKHYDFDFTFRNGQAFFGKSSKPISNPFHQLKRSKALLEQLLRNYHEAVEVVSVVVFINDACQVDVDETCDSLCLSRAGLGEFLHKISFGNPNKALENWLKLQHHPLKNLHYTYEKLDMTLPLKPGLLCAECGCEMEESSFFQLQCGVCGQKTFKKDMLERLVKEYALLFPWKTLYSTQIANFYGNLINPKSFYNELARSYRKNSSKKRSGFENPYATEYQLACLSKRLKEN